MKTIAAFIVGVTLTASAGYATDGFQHSPDGDAFTQRDSDSPTPPATRTPRPTPDHTATREAINVGVRQIATETAARQQRADAAVATANARNRIAEQVPDCDPAYQRVCIPLGGGDLDCADVGVQDFRVVGFDRHGFDRDNDGIGCES